MYVAPQYFLFSAMKSVMVFKQQWIMASASELGIETIFLHVGGGWIFVMFLKIKDFLTTRSISVFHQQ
jgi:hypothetical protein